MFGGKLIRQTNRLDEEQLTEIVMSKARSGGGDRESYPSFWQDIGMFFELSQTRAYD